MMSGKTNKLISQEGKKDYGEESAEDTKETSQGDDEFDGGGDKLEEDAQKRSRSIGRVQKRAWRGHACRRQGAWPYIIPKQQMIPRKRRKKKIRKGLTSSRRRTLSGEVAYSQKEQGTWPGMKRDYQTNQKRRRKNSPSPSVPL